MPPPRKTFGSTHYLRLLADSDLQTRLSILHLTSGFACKSLDFWSLSQARQHMLKFLSRPHRLGQTGTCLSPRNLHRLCSMSFLWVPRKKPYALDLDRCPLSFPFWMDFTASAFWNFYLMEPWFSPLQARLFAPQSTPPQLIPACWRRGSICSLQSQRTESQ